MKVLNRRPHHHKVQEENGYLNQMTGTADDEEREGAKE